VSVRLQLIDGRVSVRFVAIIRDGGGGPAERPPKRKYFTERQRARQFAAEWRRRGFAVRLLTELK
jgi:hypothetical protein